MKKKTAIRIISLFCMACLFCAVISLPTYAAENTDTFDTQKIISEALDSFSNDSMLDQIPGNVEVTTGNGDESANPNGVPSTYAVLLLDKETGNVMARGQITYVKDANGDGSTYLVGDVMLGLIISDQPEIIIAASIGDGNYVELSLVNVDMESYCSFYTADSFFETATPSNIGTDYCENVDIHYWNLVSTDDGAVFQNEKLSLNLSNYSNMKDSDTALVGPLYTNEYILGAPFTAKDGTDILGIVTFVDNDASAMIMTTLYNYNFDNHYAVIKGGSTTNSAAEPIASEPAAAAATEPVETHAASNQPANPAPAENEETKSFPVWIAIPIVFAILAFLMVRKDKHNTNETKPTPPRAQAPRQGTVILDDYPIPQPLNTLWQIRGIEGRLDGKVFTLKSITRLGRSSECDVVFPSNAAGISAIHCELEDQNGKIVLRDLQSSYGTYLAGNVKATPRVDYHLQEGDVFTLAQGGQMFRLEHAGATETKKGPSVRAISEAQTFHADLSGKITFGRDSRCQVHFNENDHAISGKHCVLYRENGTLFLMDTNSTNGTYISENQRLKPNVPYKMKAGMSFFLSSPKYTYVIIDE